MAESPGRGSLLRLLVLRLIILLTLTNESNAMSSTIEAHPHVRVPQTSANDQIVDCGGFGGPLTGVQIRSSKPL